MKLKAFAKINLTLRVFGQRPDGFHNLESIMQSVSLCDYVTVELISSGIEITCDDPSVPLGPKNIAYKAAERFLSRVKGYESGVRIHIEKKIPMAAGLAGGSADAAAVLYGLNQLMTGDSQLETGDLMKIAPQVGSDVPFCLTGGTCLVEGRGERVTKQEPLPKTYFILVKPDFEVSTKWAYEKFDKLFTSHGSRFTKFSNYLELAVIEKYPEIARIKERLLTLGCSEAQMSGSGSAVFGVTREKDKAAAVLEEIKKDCPRSFLTETVKQGVEIL